MIALAALFGSPTVTVTVSGTGFVAIERVAISFDTTVVGTSTTNAAGAFTEVFTVPASVLPGSHMVTAMGRPSRVAASARFFRLPIAAGGRRPRPVS